MPILPSGLSLALWEEALIEHDENWFSCPESHFWYHVAAPEMGEPLFEKDATVWRMPVHAPAPRNRNEVKKFIQILEMDEEGNGKWRGEWLADFPKYRALSEADNIAWQEWINRPETDAYLDRVIARCLHLAEIARNAKGHLILKDRPDVV